MRSVAIQGTKGSYSEEAAMKLFGASASIKGFSSFFDTFQALLTKSVDYALIPVRNTIVGEILAVTHIFNQTDLQVIDELPLSIQHVLVGGKNTVLKQIKSVMSHHAALAQCRSFFNENPQIKQTVGSDTASSIRQIVSEHNAENSAIGSYRAAKIYGGKILLENVADKKINHTTFYLIEN